MPAQLPLFASLLRKAFLVFYPRGLPPQVRSAISTRCLQLPFQKGADIIIAGMKGRGKNLRELFGSTVTSLAKISDVPLIVIPEGTQYRRPQIIGFAYDSDIPPRTNIHFLDRIYELAAKFQASLYFVKVVKEKSSEEFKSLPLPFRLAGIIRSADTKYDFLEGKNVAKALNEFVEHRKIDILAILPHSHSFLARLIIHSNTRDAIFNTSVPLLILSGSKKAPAIRRKKSCFAIKTTRVSKKSKH